MEDATNEVETNQCLRSPPRRRRSTFFERRESFVPLPENVDANVCKQSPTTDGQNAAELSSYLEKLQAEKEQWKLEVKSRRNKYHDLRQQYQMAAKFSGRSKMSYSTLSNEDIEFLKGKTNISKLVESQAKLHSSVQLTKALYSRAVELDNLIISECEKKVNEITEYIFDNSTVEVDETLTVQEDHFTIAKIPRK